jgi:SAM-dependent methyltransferase
MTRGVGRVTEADYLAEQYGDAERLRIRREAHERYSERPAGDFFTWVLSHLALAAGARVLDVGCGDGAYHPALLAADARVVGLDASGGMLREARERTAGRGGLVRAEAERLPFDDDSCDAGMANHVLYHVVDRVGALRELRRVVRPGGRLVLVTNARDFARELYVVHGEVARERGLSAAPGPFERFHLDHLRLVRSVLAGARVVRRENAFRFPSAEAAARYYATGPVDALMDPPADGSHRGPLVRAFAERVRDIVAREGCFRVGKTVGCFVASV